MFVWIFLAALIVPVLIHARAFEDQIPPLPIISAYVLYYAIICVGALQAWRVKRVYTLEIEAFDFAIDAVAEFNRDPSKRLAASEVKPDRFISNDAQQQSVEPVSSLLIQQLFKIWRELRRESDLAVQGFVQELAPIRMKLRSIQTSAIRLGILFTFVGLLLGLIPLGRAYQSEQFVNTDIGELISALTFAFATSVAGLLSSFVVQLFAEECDALFGEISRKARTTWMDLGHFLSQLELESDLPSHLNSVEIAADKLRKELRESGGVLRRESHELHSTIKEQGEKLAVAAGAMQDSHTFLKHLREENAERFAALEKSMQSLREFEEALPAAYEERLRKIVDTVQADSELERKAITERLDALVVQLSEKEQLGDQQMEAFRETIAVFSDAVRELKAFEQALPDGINDRLDAIYGGMTQFMEKERSQIESRLTEFSSVMRSDTELADLARSNLTDVVQSFKQSSDALTSSSNQLAKELKEQSKLLLKTQRARSPNAQVGWLPGLTFAAIVMALLVAKAAEPYVPGVITTIASSISGTLS